jgi:hypothetical protein
MSVHKFQELQKPLPHCIFVFATMTRGAETGILVPRALHEATDVLNQKVFASLMDTIVGLDYQHQVREEVPDNCISDSEPKHQNSSWGITAVSKEKVPSSVTTVMMQACLKCPKIKDLVINSRSPEKFFQGFLINRMDYDDSEVPQQRSRQGAQHIWHTDGNADKPFLSVVYTIYNGQPDSRSLSALEAGGIVLMSNLDDGRFRRSSKAQQQTPQNWSTTSYYPKTNSFYILPGYFVSHAVCKVYPGTVRYSIVMFLPLRHPAKADHQLRSDWALANGKQHTTVCDKCWSTFKDGYALVRHQRALYKKCVEHASLPR